MCGERIKRAVTGVWVILALVMTALAPAVSAEGNGASPERYRGECGQDGSSVYWSVDPAKNELTISGSGKIKSYYSVHGANQPYATLKTGRIIEKLIIEDGITEIGASAFESFHSLKGVSLPSSLTKIGGAAFMNCTSLMDITIPDSVIDIEGSAFFGCTAIRNIKIPDKVSNIRVNTFERCTSLESVELPDNLKTIEAEAFSGCKALKDKLYPAA